MVPGLALSFTLDLRLQQTYKPCGVLRSLDGHLWAVVPSVFICDSVLSLDGCAASNELYF